MVYYYLGYFWQKSGNADKASACYDMGASYEALGQTEKARECFEQAALLALCSTQDTPSHCEAIPLGRLWQSHTPRSIEAAPASKRRTMMPAVSILTKCYGKDQRRPFNLVLDKATRI